MAEIEASLEMYNALCEHKLYDKKKGVLDLSKLPYDAMSFGREYTSIRDFFGKLLYVLAQTKVSSESPIRIEEIFQWVKNYLGIKKIIMSRCQDYCNDVGVIEEDTKAGESYGYYFGEIDHQSVGDIFEFLRNNGLTVKDFILGRAFSVVTTCDG
jgi:hypothetical protein